MKLVSQSELAELTGKAWRTIAKRLREGDVGQQKGELWRSDQALEAIYGQQDTNQLEDARTQLAIEQTARLARERAIAEGDLFSLSAIADEVAKLVASTVTRLHSIPDAVAQRFDANVAPRVRAAVRDALDGALNDLKANSGRIARGDSSSRGVSPAAASNGKRVG